MVTNRTPRWPTGAGRAALQAYRQLPVAARLHATVRWWSAPFPAVEAVLPATGRILEIGCGHGLFCTYIALAGTDRRVVGVDIDPAKIAQAGSVAHRLTGADLRFELATSGAVAPGPWDAIAIIDMLYLLPAAEQRNLLTAAAAQLAPGGVLLVKEMSTTPSWKARWNLIQETLAVSILGITERADKPDSATPLPGAAGKRSRFDFVAPHIMVGWLTDLGLTTSERRLDRHRLHPHHLLLGRRPGPARVRRGSG